MFSPISCQKPLKAHLPHASSPTLTVPPLPSQPHGARGVRCPGSREEPVPKEGTGASSERRLRRPGQSAPRCGGAAGRHAQDA